MITRAELEAMSIPVLEDLADAENISKDKLISKILPKKSSSPKK